MNIKLAELLESVLPDFTEASRTSRSIRYQYTNKEIEIKWYENGRPHLVIYWLNNQMHRPITEGPAYQFWHRSADYCDRTYMLFGQEIFPSLSLH